MMENPIARKSLGQYWLKDDSILADIVRSARLTSKDTVLEVGPGPGFLTKHLVAQAGKVIAVEVDKPLAKGLAGHFQAPNLRVVAEDVLKFDLTKLPEGYKVVANIPYYLTSHLLRLFCTSANPPSLMVLLVQKEVAERVAAKPGKMSALSVSVQLYYQPELGQVVPANVFQPPPKVDSQVLILRRHSKPLFKDLDEKEFFRVVRAGFSSRRKKLRSSLSGGLRISKEETDRLLSAADINGDLRPENLTLQQWHRLYLQSIIKKDFRSLL